MHTVKIVETKEVQVSSLIALCNVRYWEDGTYNGNQLADDNPDFPGAKGDIWIVEIDIDTGVIKDWPKGNVASVHFKVCDEGTYSLYDEDCDLIKSVEGYVPSIMSPGGSGYGDYVIMDIDENGKIDKWDPSLVIDFSDDVY